MRSLISFVLFFSASVMHANEKATGIVQIHGSSYSRAIVLTKSSQAKNANGEITLCDSELSKKIGRLSGMTAEVEGSWEEKKHKKTGKVIGSCFQASQFIVTKVSSGREALVGKLEKQGEKFVLISKDGNTRELESIPQGLANLAGKHVIIDAKQMNEKNKVSWKIVSYAEHP